MKRYMVKGTENNMRIVEVLQKDRGGYTVKVKQEKRWGFKEEVHQMSADLFETCLRTGYFIEIKSETQVRYA